jgi:hypothetical protein
VPARLADPDHPVFRLHCRRLLTKGRFYDCETPSV